MPLRNLISGGRRRSGAGSVEMNNGRAVHKTPASLRRVDFKTARHGVQLSRRASTVNCARTAKTWWMFKHAFRNN